MMPAAEAPLHFAAEFVQLATAGRALELAAIYELRDPYTFERAIENAMDRMLVVLRRWEGSAPTQPADLGLVSASEGGTS